MPLFESLEIRVSGRDNTMPMPYVHFLMAGFLFVVESTDFVKTLGWTDIPNVVLDVQMFLRSQQMAGLYNRKTTGDLCAVAAGGKENTWYEGKYQGYFASH